MTERCFFLINKLSAIIIVLNLFNFTVSAQNNLVPNGGFEIYTTCPPLGTSISYAIPWFQPNSFGGSNGSSDYYNTCACPTFGCPPNSAGFQYPRSGNGLVGIAMFFDSTNNNINNWREYIEIMLNDSLKAGKKYCVRFYINKGNWSSYAVKNIQAVLTSDSLLYNDPSYSYIQGVIPIMEADSIVTDTLNWLPIETTYKAHGGEQFLTIGNFDSGENTVYQYVWPYNGTPNTLGYYLFDDVSIYEQPEINAGNDTLIQIGDSEQLGIPGRADVLYSWQPTTGLNNPNISNPIAHPNVSTMYILTVTDTNSLACTNIFVDTVRICVGAVGVIENSNDVVPEVMLYPNPASSQIQVKMPNTGKKEVSITLYNINGKKMKEIITNESETIININDLENGLYGMSVIKENINYMQKFVKMSEP